MDAGQLWANAGASGRMATEARDITGISDFTEGVSKAGMEAYMEYLKIDVLGRIIDKLSDTAAIETAINNGWQGVSRDRFLQQFGNSISTTSKELYHEFENLAKRLSELYQDYFEQDLRMLEEI